MRLDELKKKLTQELGKLEDETEKEIEADDSEEMPAGHSKNSPSLETLDKPSKTGSYTRRAVEYRSTPRKTRGKVFYMYYDIDYKDMAEYLKKEVPGVTWTVPKTRRVFRAIRKFIGFSDPRRDK
jgi:hypothetical protein